LRWHLARAGIAEMSDAMLEQIALSQRERAKTLYEMAANSLFFFRAPESYDEKAVRKHITPEIAALLPEIEARLSKIEPWAAPALHACINDLAAEKAVSLGKLAQPIRLAVSGGTVSPPIDATLAILGKTEVLARLSAARARWGA
jgi:glutamyl-tRNA synthetase